ncbi:MAG: adenylate/guanylate cyclase domain-containing protein [Candidatus Sericytochromatia bacterium]
MSKLKIRSKKLVSIRTILIILSIVQISLVTSITGWLSLRNGQQSVKDLVNTLLNEVTSRINNNLSQFLETPLIVNDLNIDSLRIGNINVDDFKTLESSLWQHEIYLWRLMHLYPSISYIYFGNENGECIGITRKEEKGKLVYLFEGSNKTTNGKLITYQLDDNGKRNKITGSYKYDPRSRPWYITAKKEKKSTWLDVYPFFTWPKLGITTVKPYIDKKGKFHGVVASDIILSDFSKFLNSLKIGKSGKTFILSRDGNMIATSSLEPLTSQTKKGLVRIPAINSIDPLIKNTTENIINNFKSFKDINNTEQVIYKNNGKKYLYQITPLNKDFNWLVVVVVPEDDFMELINKNTRNTILLCILAMIISVLLGVILTRRITYPLLLLSNEMNHIANFDLKEENNTYSTSLSEIDTIQNSLVSMKNGLRSFEKYVSSDIVRRLIKNKKEATLGVEHANVTVFFSDVVDFTTISETLELNNLVDLISEYLGEMSNIILFSGGTLDKYIGDAIMSFWNAPETVERHSLRACEVALKCMEELNYMQVEWIKRGLPPLKCRIGLHTGAVLVGNLGSIRRMDYTIIGDTVNLASRLEGLNKYYGTDIMISEDVFNEVKDIMFCRPLDFVMVKGRTSVTLIYELVNYKDLVTEREIELKESYSEALYFYKVGDFFKASKAFREIVINFPDDIASKKLLNRCIQYEKKPPEGKWTGVFVLSEK